MYEKREKQEKSINMEDALTKGRAFCAYQERYHQEVRDKLYEWGLWPDGVEQVILTLIEEKFLNEERFARAYVSGKFRIKKWGRLKIKQGLKFRKISDYCIKKGFTEINDREYEQTLKKVMDDYQRTLKESNKLKALHKTARYAISRGFESDLVWGILKGVDNE